MSEQTMIDSKSKTRPKGSGGSSGLISANGNGHNLQTLSNGRPKGKGGSPALHDTSSMPYQPQTLVSGRPKGSGGSPGLAAAYNGVGNDWVRQAVQQPILIDSAVVIYSHAIENDPYDPGLMINLGIVNLIKGDVVAAYNLFVAAFELSEKNLDALYAIMGLPAGQYKFPRGKPFYEAETLLRKALTQCAKMPPESPRVEEKRISPEEAKEFLYIKKVDAEKD